METCVKVFNDFLVYEKKSSNNTVESYMRDIHQFASFCTGNNILKISQIDNSFITKYLDYLTKVGKSEATKLRKENTSFWNRLKRLFVSTDEPTRNIPSYLRQIVPMLKENDEFAEIFQRLVEKEKVVEVKNKEQLFMSMLLER